MPIEEHSACQAVRSHGYGYCGLLVEVLVLRDERTCLTKNTFVQECEKQIES